MPVPKKSASAGRPLFDTGPGRGNGPPPTGPYGPMPPGMPPIITTSDTLGNKPNTAEGVLALQIKRASQENKTEKVSDAAKRDAADPGMAALAQGLQAAQREYGNMAPIRDMGTGALRSFFNAPQSGMFDYGRPGYTPPSVGAPPTDPRNPRPQGGGY